jgi:hypothetical protein
VVCGDRRRGVASVKPGRVLAGGALFGGVAWIGVLMARRIFIGHLDALDAELRKPALPQSARTDLPAQVIALAKRMGACADGAAGHVVFEQSGQMWRTPASAPSAFTARQTTRHDAPGFLWRAAIGPIVVADYFVAGTGGLEVKLLGAFPIARAVGGTAANQAEALRYLAELPWCPDAILLNRALDWTAVDANTIKVATGVGAARGEVTFTLDDEGLIARASAPSRAYAEHGRTTARPWRGRFWDYQRVGGHLIPIQGEVAWGLDAGDFVYWRGRILAWNDTRPMAQ